MARQTPTVVVAKAKPGTPRSGKTFAIDRKAVVQWKNLISIKIQVDFAA
jgi:hypothetical protein